MTARIWFKLVRNSFLAAALLTAAQVGFGSGVGVIDWQRGGLTALGWGQLLTWIAFVFAVGVLGGAAVGQRFVPRRLRIPSSRPRGRTRFGVTVVAALGAGLGSAAAFPLLWLPVMTGRLFADPNPIQSVATTAGAGALVGVALALATLTWGAVAAGAGVAAFWVWLFALVSAALGGLNGHPVSPGLGLLDAPESIPASAWWVGPYLMVGLALISGLAVAAIAGWRGAGWLGIGLSGLAGPLLVASPYLITGWGLTGNGEDSRPYEASVVAILVGLIASAAVAAPQRRRDAGRPRLSPINGPIPVAPVGGSRASRPVAIESARPLAISSYAEPAYPAAYSADQAVYRTEPVYLEPVQPYPAADRPGRKRASTPVTTYSADPYSSDAFEVSSQTFTADVFPNSPAARPVAVPPVVAPAPAPVAPPVFMQPAELAAGGFARPAAPAEPGHDERVVRAPAVAPAPRVSAPVRPTPSVLQPIAATPPKSTPSGRKAARAARTAAAAAAAREKADVAAVAAKEKAEARELALAREQAVAREKAEARARADAEKAAARSRPKTRAKAAPTSRPAPEPAPVEQPVSALRAGSIEGEVVSGSTTPGGSGPIPPTGPARPANQNRRGRKTGRNDKEKDKELRKGEREHIDWVSNLVHIQADSELKTSKER